MQAGHSTLGTVIAADQSEREIAEVIRLVNGRDSKSSHWSSSPSRDCRESIAEHT